MSSTHATPSASAWPAPPKKDDERERELADGLGILVVEDRHSDRMALEAALAPLGRKLVLVASGREALARVLAEDFGLIVLDVQMPKIDGFQLAQMMRNGQRNRDTAIVFVTDTAPREDAMLRGYALGTVDFLVKPFQPVVLRAKARVFLQLQMRTMQLREAQDHRDNQELAREREAERVARDVAEAARARAEFLVRASAMLASSLEHEDTLSSVASAAVPAIADWCAVDVVDGEVVKPVAVAHVDPAKVALVKTLRQRYPPARDEHTGVMSVIRNGTPQFYSEVSHELLATSARDADHLRIAEELGIRSAMLVPINYQDATIGVITFVLAESDRRYTMDDLRMAVQLGESAGAAIANSRLYAEATKAVHLNELFSGVVGHDLRNPLAAIMAATQLLLARDEVGSGVPALQRILASTERMARMIDQLLDFTRVRAGGGIPSDPQPMDLAIVARDVVGELQDAHPDSDMVFETKGTLTGTWDPDRLAQLVSNLVSNAVEHGRRDSPVLIEADGTRADVIRLRVSNAGAIPAEFVPVVFEPFRGRQHKRDRKSGLGLGLYIAQQITLVHGGTIELVTSDPQRTTFVVTLPRTNKKASQR